MKEKLYFFIKGCFVPSLAEIGPMDLKKKSKIWKVTNTNWPIDVKLNVHEPVTIHTTKRSLQTQVNQMFQKQILLHVEMDIQSKYSR